MNITLISANSYRLVDIELKKIIKGKKYFQINLNKSDISSLIEEASYAGFLSEEKTIVVTNADFFGTSKINEEDLSQITSYIENPNPNTKIIFTTTNGIDSRKKQVKYIKENYSLINIPSWDKKKTREEAQKYLTEKGYKIDYNTVNFLIENTYNNIDVLFNELDKIICYYSKPCQIIYEDVIKIVGREVDSNSFHFISAVIDKDLEKSINLMNSLKVYKVESLSLIMLLAREYRLMYYVKNLRNNNYSMPNICKELSLAEWQVSKLYNNGLKYNEKELLKNLYMLGELDYKIKRGIYDKDIALYPFLLEVCV